MCGIAGIWNLNQEKVNSDGLKKFTDALYHRGPDKGGYQLLNEDTLGLGHRRLAILDLAPEADQPMHHGDKRYWIVYNGEIFNFLELREELKKYGYSFRTESDTEVVIAAYDKWKEKALNKFNGMWAFVIWDDKTRTMFAARDRYGIKPFHYKLTQNQFAFASETIAFKYLDGFKRKINDQTLLHSINTSGLIEPLGFTLYEDIYQLPAGHYMTLRKEDAQPKFIKWWSTSDNLVDVPKSYDEQVEYFKYLFKEACKIRMRSDVPLACALSGGLDSSSVYAMVNSLKEDSSQRFSHMRQEAYVASFPDTIIDEYQYAKQVADYVGTNLNVIVPDKNQLQQDLVQSVEKFDAITATPINSVSTIYKAMRESDVIVSLDGHGMDELMFGYKACVLNAVYEYSQLDQSYFHDLKNTYLNLFHESEQDKISKSLNELDAVSSFGYKQKLKRFLKSMKEEKDKYLAFELKAHDFDQWHNNKKVPAFSSPFAMKEYYPKKSGSSEQALFDDFHFKDIPYNLRDFDRASMQYGIEIRMPFMDYRIVSYCFSLPMQSKLGGGYTKRVLRDAMRGMIPEDIRTRTYKIGLGAPIINWFNDSLNQYLLDVVNSSSFLSSEYWNGKLLRELVIEKNKNKSWTDKEATRFWKILNAHIILENN